MVQAWYMDESADDPRLPHRGDPCSPVGLEQLRRLGVFYWKLDADKYENDPELEKIRKERNYSWMDIITICKDKLPDYEEKIKIFYKEHLHLDDEIRYILDGSGYFDVRDKEDKWIRIFMEKGDMITLPAGIYHRFTLDEKMANPLGCVLKNRDDFDPQFLKRKRLLFFCTETWPQYKSEEETWPPEGSISRNIILQLDLLCKREGKWRKSPTFSVLGP